MVANPGRRAALLDAAVECLGADGARALTFRRVDAHAGLPTGTATNYFRSRADLLLGVAERVFEQLAPDPQRVAGLSAAAAGPDAAGAFASYVAERLLADPAVGLALVELRLEAARDATVAAVVGPFLRAGLEADQAFAAGQGLPGGATAVELQHYAVLGLVLDRLTVPLNPSRDPLRAAASMARALVRDGDGAGSASGEHGPPARS